MKVLLLSRKYPLLSSGICLIFGIILAFSIQKVLADNTIIYACIKTSNGSIRIVSANTTCGNNETALSWNQQGQPGATGSQGPTGPQGPSGGTGLPFFCQGCALYLSGNKVTGGKDMSNAFIIASLLHGMDMSNTNFTDAIVANNDFTNANLTNVNFTRANAENSQFPGTTLNGANFTDADLTGNFNNSFNPVDFTNANLSNVNFTGANLTSATNMNTAVLTDVTWSHTTCPDGTNSFTNGSSPESCVGHL